MSDIAISVESIGKRYRIGLKDERHDTLFGALASWAKSPLENFRRLRSLSHFDSTDGEDILWALRGVSFQVEQGEVVGMIGRNGAGKSTLLKILSSITKPTEGRVVLSGRVSSLLEVGTGFHPELTGRENIYLNGTVLGMSKTEVDRKFDEIVDFSGVERFMETPVKRYSSGMKVRLAFAVAAHLEPEILLIDEVLAVGDVEFQKKCLGKMEDVAHGGRTVLFVSHDMGAIQQLCDRTILLTDGQIEEDGPTAEVVSSYLSGWEEKIDEAYDLDSADRTGDGSLRLTKGFITNGEGVRAHQLVAGDAITFRFEYENPANVQNAEVTMTIYNNSGVAVTNVDTKLNGEAFTNLSRTGEFSCQIPRLPFLPGRYKAAVAVHVNGVKADHIPHAVAFDVVSSSFFETSRTPPSRYATVMVDHRWHHRALHPSTVASG